MEALRNLAKRIKTLNVNDCIYHLSLNKSFTDYIIELNTKKQLYEKGVGSDGIRIGSYSPKTKQIKDSKGQISDHVTLLDTGEFYKSFSVFLSGSDFVISANTIKDTDDLIYKYGEEILGLNEESLILLREKAKDILIPYVKSVILQR